MLTGNAAPSGSVDLTAIGQSKFRNRLRDLVEQWGGHLEECDFWTDFSKPTTIAVSGSTLVVGDLANIVHEYRACGAHIWAASVRRRSPYFLAFVRTERDRRCAALLHDLLRASDMRLNVCNDATDWTEISACLRSAVSALRPEALLNVIFIPNPDALFLQFGDGLAGLVTWDQLGLTDLRQQLVGESATVGPMGNTIELATIDEDLFEIDSASARAILDESFAATLADVSDQSDQTFGGRLRAARKMAGLTQTQLSERTGLDQAVISRMERGRHRPRIDTLRRMASGLGLTVSGLLEGE